MVEPVEQTPLLPKFMDPEPSLTWCFEAAAVKRKREGKEKKRTSFMETPAGCFYGGGYSMAPAFPLSGSAAMTPPSTPSAAGVRAQNQKLDLMLSMFTEQKKTIY